MPNVRLRYRTIEFDHMDVHVRTLRDNQQYDDAGGIASRLGISSATWPLFGVIWASDEVLAHHMSDYDVNGKRILEVGCGIALASLVLNERKADITATDYHPETESFLKENVRINSGTPIPFECTGWADNASTLGRFDLIIGSDLLYEREHIQLLPDFIESHAKPVCEVIIVDPGRGHIAAFSKQMERLGFTHRDNRPENTSYLVKPFTGKVHCYQR
jgi:predicted nicotinamide N-methyase